MDSTNTKSFHHLGAGNEASGISCRALQEPESSASWDVRILGQRCWRVTIPQSASGISSLQQSQNRVGT